MKARSICFLASLFLAILAPALPSSACSCMQPDPVDFLETGEFVFVGSLVDRDEAPIGQFGDVAYTFSVDAVYVGDIRDAEIAVWSAPDGAGCGFEVVPGEPVGIVAAIGDGALRGGLCGTVGAADLAAAAEGLGIEPYVPEDVPETTTTTLDTTTTQLAVQENEDEFPVLVVAGAGAVALLVGGAVAIGFRSTR